MSEQVSAIRDRDLDDDLDDLPEPSKEDRYLGWLRRNLVWIAPIIVAIIAVFGWEQLVRIYEIPHYIVPAPTLIFEALIKDLPSMLKSLRFTAELTLLALVLAVVGGLILGTIFATSRITEICFFPFAVILQVTPVIAIAPLILIYVESTFFALLLCAWLVAFFPMLSNTVIGLRSASHNLRDLFRLYGATPWQRLRYLMLPSALPYFMSALKISGGLALIGAVVAEFVAGTAGDSTGLASRILESSYRFEIPRMFAALFLISSLGIVLFLFTSWLSFRVLGHWHESETTAEK